MENTTELSLEQIKQNLSEKQLQILNLYLLRKTQAEICKEVGCTRSLIDSLVKKFGLTRFRSRNKYTLNESKVNLQNPEFWYFLGWFASDGNLHLTNSGSEIVQFTLKDEEPLQKLRDSLEYTGKITLYHKSVGDYYFLGITNKKLVTTIKEVWQNPYRKTYTLTFPEFPNEQCCKLFVRGFWDGDGCFTLNKTNGAHSATAHCASIEFSKSLCACLQTFGINCHFYEIGLCPELRICKQSEFIKFVDWLYSTNDELYLTRKRDKAFAFKEKLMK